ncbi:hypothetical protein [Carnobacterium maltaromaticum]|uniref:hypothetical protein n=1 Tax=Carnobacterium maltaromaticum TaxID=2751 RepID=UPI0012FA885D|nr:hypothetical protein [Carnobacterium maltaromaticum]
MCQLKLKEDSPGKLTKTFLSEVSCLTNFNKIQLKQLGWIDAGSVIVRSFYNSRLNRWFSILIQKEKVSVVKKDITDKGTLEEPWSDFILKEWILTQENQISCTDEIGHMVAYGSPLDLQVIRAAITYVVNL